LRILLSTPFYPPEFGGISFHVEKLALHLSKRKHEVIVLSQSNRDTYWAENNNLEIYKVLSKSPPPFPFETIKSFKLPTRNVLKILDRLDESQEIDVIHTHGHHYPINWISAYWAKKRNKNVLLTLHGMYALNPNKAGGKTIVEEFFNQTVFKWFLDKMDCIIGLAPPLVQYALKYAGKKKIKTCVIPNGVELELYKKNLDKKRIFRKIYNLPEEDVIVLYRGRFANVKGVLTLSKIIKKISKEVKNTFFLFVGGGLLKNKIKKILCGLRNCRVLDWAPKDRIHHLYIASDIYVLPSKWEAVPITIIEAMASQLFIITSKVGGIPYVLSGYPFKIFIDPNNPFELYLRLKKIIHLYQISQESFRIDTKTYTSLLSKFDWKTIVERLINLYNCFAYKS